MLVQSIEYRDGLADLTAYGREEVEATLAEAHAVKAEYDALVAEAYELVPYNPIWGPQLNEAQQPLYDYLVEINADEPQIVSRKRHVSEIYPVKTWHKEIAKARRQMAKVRRLMNEMEKVTA